MDTSPTRQLAILDRWQKYLDTLPYVTSHFVEGSLVEDTGKPSCPSSDIDMRIVVKDNMLSMVRLDKASKLLMPLEPYRLSVQVQGNRGGDYQFIRVITDEGVVVDLDIYKQSEAEYMHSVILPPVDAWPTTKIITPATIRQQTTDFAVVMAAIPSSFYSGEFLSTAFQLDLYRVDLVKLMYDCAGIDYARRYKHFTELFPEEWLSDLNDTYDHDYGFPTFSSMAKSMSILWYRIGKYLQILSDKVGGGFDAQWYWNIFETVKGQLIEFE